MIDNHQELRQVARQVYKAKLPPKPKVPPSSDGATPDQLETNRLTARVAALAEERDQLKKKYSLTIALAEA